MKPTSNPAHVENEATSAPDADTESHAVRQALALGFFGYHQGPRPRMGEAVRARGGYRGVVAAHSSSKDRIYIELDSGDRVIARTNELKPAGAARKSLREMLQSFEHNALGADCTMSMAQLAMHSLGLNGSRYANRAAALWFTRALVHMGYLLTDTPALGRWLNTEIAQLEATGVVLPTRMSDEELEACAVDPTKDGHAPKALELARAAVAQGLLLAREQIDLTCTDAPNAEGATDGLERCLAVELSTERTCVIVGPTDLRVGGGGVTVIDLDTLWSFTRHISGLELTGDAMDPGWFWDIVTQSALKHPKGAVVPWFAEHLQGPEGVDVDVPERRHVATVAALMSARYALHLRDPAKAKRMHKRAKELARTLDKPIRAHLTARAPELVAPDIRDKRFSTDLDVLLPEVVASIEAMLKVLPAPAPAPVEAQPASAPDEAGAGELLAPEVEPVDVVEPAPTVAAPRAEKVSFARPTRVLRFNLDERLLFAGEWKLADTDNANADAVIAALEWLEQRLGMALPKHWSEGAHEVERAGVTVQIEASALLFAFRLDHPDTEHPTRWWRLEATVLAGRQASGGMVGLRMQVRDLVEGLPAPVRSVPGLVRSWATRPGLVLAGARAGNVTHIRAGESIGRLIRILRNGERETVICVVPQGGARLPVQGPLAGLVRVITVPSTLEGYAEKFGALGPSDIHLFRSGEPRPEVLSAAMPDWVETVRSRALDARHFPQTPTFADVRAGIRGYREEQVRELRLRLAEAEAEPAEAVADPGPSIEDIQNRVRSEVRTYEELLDVAEHERDQAIAERDAANAERDALRHAFARLQAAREVTSPAALTRPAVPDTLEALPSWAPSIAPRVVIADKALRHAVKIEHREVNKIFAALQALHDHYWPMKFADSDDARAEAHDAWARTLSSHRLTFSPVGKAIRTGRYQDEYKATVDGTVYMADMHVSGNASFDPTRCLRVYLVVDEHARRIVVTHLPTHLTNSLT